ncbi:MAG: 1-acyl-sn-glycerol-3-phosphate acyltransferase [Firmicutes bacterium]|nr:1-acyl-sn-glycerol-3-phosphate acyltransferase [Bacillota bacterium]
MKNKKYRVRRPSRFMLWAASAFFAPLYKIKHKIKFDRTGLKGLKPPYIVLANHTSWNDFAIVGMTLFPRRANFVATSMIKRDPLLRMLTKSVGTIHKKVYWPDSDSLRRVQFVIEDKGIIVMMPAGDVSIDGTPNYLDNTTARYIKSLKIPVVALNINGGYLHMPRFHKKTNRGAKIEVTTKLVFDGQDLECMKNEDIYNRLWDELYFNDAEWQKQKRMIFKGKKLAEGMQNILFKCARCMAEFSHKTKGRKIWCTECNNEFFVNDYFEFEASDDNKCYDNIYEWNNFQKESISKEIENEEFSFSADTMIYDYKRDSINGYEKRGDGTLTLSLKQLIYDGIYDGEVVTNARNILRQPNISMINCECIDIPNAKGVDRYYFNDRRQYVKFVLTFNLIRLKYYPYDYRDSDEKN